MISCGQAGCLIPTVIVTVISICGIIVLSLVGTFNVHASALGPAAVFTAKSIQKIKIKIESIQACMQPLAVGHFLTVDSTDNLACRASDMNAQQCIFVLQTTAQAAAVNRSTLSMGLICGRCTTTTPLSKRTALQLVMVC